MDGTTVTSHLFSGRASGTPTLDMFMTLLYLGREGFAKLLKERKERFTYLKDQLKSCAEKHGQRLLNTPHNNISMGNYLSGIQFLKIATNNFFFIKRL